MSSIRAPCRPAQVDARLDARTPCPARAAARCRRRCTGSSCVSSPMPCPVRWMKGRRSRRRRSRRGRPRRPTRRSRRAGPRAHRRLLGAPAAPRSTPRTSGPARRRRRRCGCSRSSSRSAVVPPMSTTTGSPASITRSETSWCGLAPLGPEPTMTKSTAACPSARIASAMSAADLALGAARPQPLAHPRRAPGRSPRPAARSASTSAGALRIRSARDHLAGQALLARRAAPPRSASTFSAAHRGRPRATRAGPAGSRPATSANGSSVSAQVDASRCRGRRPGEAGAAGRSSVGTSSARVAVGRQHQAGQPLEPRRRRSR